MGELGWRAKSSQLTREAKPIKGLRDDFGIRLKSAVETMREIGPDKSSDQPRRGYMNILQSQNRGVEERAKRDTEAIETDEVKEAKRMQSLEAKAQLYDRLQGRLDLDDEATNDLHQVDFIAKALANQDQGNLQTGLSSAHVQQFSSQPVKSAASLHPEEILKQQQAIRLQMQGGKAGREEYSTYEDDVAHLQSRFQHVDELNEMNASRQAEFEAVEERKREKENKKRKEADNHKRAILKQLLLKKQRLKLP